MRFTLEEGDLIQLIGQALGYELQPEDVTVNADPFEVRIKNVNLQALAEAKTKKTDIEVPFAEKTEDDEQENEEEEAAETILTMGEILSHSTELSSKPQRNPSPRRPLGPLESEDAPPITEAELSAYK